MASERDVETYRWVRANFKTIYAEAVKRVKAQVEQAVIERDTFKRTDPCFKVLGEIERENRAYQEHPMAAFEQELKMHVATLKTKIQNTVAMPTFTTPPYTPGRTLMTLTEEYIARVTALQTEMLDKLTTAQEQAKAMLGEFCMMAQAHYDKYVERTHTHVDRILALEAQRTAFSEEEERLAIAQDKRLNDRVSHLMHLDWGMGWGHCCINPTEQMYIDSIKTVDDTFKDMFPEWFERYQELYARINDDPVYAETFDNRCPRCKAGIAFGNYLAPYLNPIVGTPRSHQCQIAKSSNQA